MADAVTTSTIVNGPKNLVMKFVNQSDGTGESSVTKVDVSAQSCDRVRIMEIKYDTVGTMNVSVNWAHSGSNINKIAYLNGHDTLNFRRFGGMPFPTAATSGIAPDIEFTTDFTTGVTGSTSLAQGSGYTVVLDMMKDYTSDTAFRTKG